MRCAALSSPTSSQVTRGLLKSFIFIIILGLASSCEAQEPQDAIGYWPFADPAPEPATRLLSGRVPDPTRGYFRSPQAAIAVECAQVDGFSFGGVPLRRATTG